MDHHRTAVVTFGCLLLAQTCACSSAGGGDEGDDGGTDPGSKVTKVAEKEPNNGPDAAGAQDVGGLPAAGTLVISGELSSGGTNGMQYTGDFDLYVVDVTEPGALSIEVAWESGADIDLGVYDPKLMLVTGEGAQAVPIESKLAYASGRYTIALFSKNDSAAYTLTIGYQKAEDGGDCPSTSPLAAEWSGGCQMSLSTAVCSTADLTGGKSFELAWSTNTTFCEGPHTVYLGGDPPSSWQTGNLVTFSILSTVGPDARQGMTRNIGGYLNINAQDLANLTSASGVYYYRVASFHGSASEVRAFHVLK
jgi:hypothetical protein